MTSPGMAYQPNRTNRSEELTEISTEVVNESVKEEIEESIVDNAETEDIEIELPDNIVEDTDENNDVIAES